MLVEPDEPAGALLVRATRRSLCTYRNHLRDGEHWYVGHGWFPWEGEGTRTGEPA